MFTKEQYSFINQVKTELEMDQKNFVIFPPPKFYEKYQRSVIYDLNKPALDLFRYVANFNPDVRTVDQIRRSIIMYLERYPQYQDNNYISIWCKFAHKFYILNYEKVEIEFEKYYQPKIEEIDNSIYEEEINELVNMLKKFHI